MLYFPQLTSGASAQYPLVKRRAHRTITNIMLDGRIRRLLDPSWSRIEWDLEFRALTTAERAEIEGFFQSVEGRLGEFTFLDPTDNLLRWSGDLTSSFWVKDPLLTLTTGVTDPEGGAEAMRLTNSGPTSQKIEQTIDGPGWFHYCLSLQARSDGPVNLTLFRASGGTEDAVVVPVGANWQRLSISGRTQSTAEHVTFGVRLGAGSSVEVFGMQSEAQPAPSDYRKTTSQSGVYAAARFDDDSLTVISDGPEQHDCSLRVVARVSNEAGN